jgi:hypothetical protein
VPDEPTQERPRRRRPVLLAMLAAAALLVALAGSGAGSGGSTPSRDQLSPGAPATDQQGQQGLTRRGRQCHHDRDRQRQRQQPNQPPV